MLLKIESEERKVSMTPTKSEKWMMERISDYEKKTQS